MNRRAFLSTLIGGVAAAAAVRTWPFRAYSFPSEVKIAPIAAGGALTIEMIERTLTEMWENYRYIPDVIYGYDSDRLTVLTARR